MTTSQARRERAAERVWEILASFRGERIQHEVMTVAERLLTDALLAFAAQEAAHKEKDHGTRPGVAGSDRVVATGPSFSATILAHTQARSCLLTVHGDSEPCGTCAVCLLVGAEAALAGKEAELRATEQGCKVILAERERFLLETIDLLARLAAAEGDVRALTEERNDLRLAQAGTLDVQLVLDDRRELTQENDALKAEQAVAQAAKDHAALRRGTLGNMLRYIAFVLAGDETADAQLAADRAQTAIIDLRARLAAAEGEREWTEEQWAQAFEKDGWLNPFAVAQRKATLITVTAERDQAKQRVRVLEGALVDLLHAHADVCDACIRATDLTPPPAEEGAEG